MQPVTSNSDNWRNYQKLLVSLEASERMLNLLLAVCDDRSLRDRLIDQYETELRQQAACYRIWLSHREPSLRQALLDLTHAQPQLSSQPAIVTVLGIDDLISIRMDAPQSERERFFFSLQWTRESLREFQFPIILWLSETVMVQLAEQAPDFWSWRGGVYWFEPESKAPSQVIQTSAQRSSLLPGLALSSFLPSYGVTLPLPDLCQQISALEQQDAQSPLLSTLYDQLARAHLKRIDYGQAENYHQERDLTDWALQQALNHQQRLALKAEQASTLKQMGWMHFRHYNDCHAALQYYVEALGLFRAARDQQGEADALKAIGDMQQYLEQNQEALISYNRALTIYRAIHDRWGEAGALKAIGDIQQGLNQYGDATEHYQQALQLYREIADRLGEANTLQAIGNLQDSPIAALRYYQQAQALYEQMDDRYSQSRNLSDWIAEAQLQAGQPVAAIQSWRQAAALADKTESASIRERALQRIADMQSDPPAVPVETPQSSGLPGWFTRLRRWLRRSP